MGLLRLAVGPVLSVCFAAALLWSEGPFRLAALNNGDFNGNGNASGKGEGALLSRIPLFPLLPSAWRENGLRARSPELLLRQNASQLVGLIESKSQAFDLGRSLAAAEAELAHHTDAAGKSTALSAAAKKWLRDAARVLVGEPTLEASLSLDQLRGLRAALQEFEDDRGTASRIAGFFSLVNIMFFIAVVGIMGVSVPFLMHFVGPLMATLAKFVEGVLVPLAIQMHRLGVLELSAYILNCWLVAEGLRWEDTAGVFIALFGVLGSGLAFTYSIALFAGDTDGSKRAFVSSVNSYVFAFTAPIAVLFQSSLFGWVTVLSLYGVLGFSAAAYGLCYVIGFNNRGDTERCLAASLLLVAIFAGFRSRLVPVPTMVLTPFASPVLIMGSNVFFLAASIVSSRWHSSGSDWVRANAFLVAALAAALAFGNIYNIRGMANTAATWGVLFAFDKTAELPVWNNKGMFLLGLMLTFVSLFMMSLFLNSHPDWIASLFDTDYLLK
jgi:hypothetical protein